MVPFFHDFLRVSFPKKAGWEVCRRRILAWDPAAAGWGLWCEMHSTRFPPSPRLCHPGTGETQMPWPGVDPASFREGNTRDIIMPPAQPHLRPPDGPHHKDHSLIVLKLYTKTVDNIDFLKVTCGELRWEKKLEKSWQWSEHRSNNRDFKNALADC